MAFCPRCDREYPDAKTMQMHLELHDDYDPELFGENPMEVNDSGPAEPEGYSNA